MASGINDFLDDIQNAEFGEFEPRPYYEPDSDSLVFYLRNEQSYRKRLNGLLTLFLSTKDDSLVGCEVKGVQRMLRQFPRMRVGFAVTVHSKSIKLGIFLGFALASTPDDLALQEQYEDELNQFDEVDIDSAELIPA